VFSDAVVEDLRISSLPLAETATLICRNAGSAAAQNVFTLNLDHVVKMRKDAKFRAAYLRAGLITADGFPIVLACRLEASFDKDGKQVVTTIDDNWVMRNSSIPYRMAPKKDNPDMYEIRSENPDAPLAPGRYALVLKGLAYDFSVEGPVTDPRQCLERLVATNGRFYSECKK
jgi:hypothetical protein